MVPDNLQSLLSVIYLSIKRDAFTDYFLNFNR
jgi:hypothetical protein